MNDEIKRARLDSAGAQELAQEQMRKSQEDSNQRMTLDEEIAEAQEDLEIVRKFAAEDKEKRLQAKKAEEKAERRNALARISFRTARDRSKQRRLAPHEAKDRRARMNVQLMRDRNRFIAESADEDRELVEGAQSLLDAYKAIISMSLSELQSGFRVWGLLDMDWAWIPSMPSPWAPLNHRRLAQRLALRCFRRPARD